MALAPFQVTPEDPEFVKYWPEEGQAICERLQRLADELHQRIAWPRALAVSMR